MREYSTLIQSKRAPKETERVFAKSAAMSWVKSHISQSAWPPFRARFGKRLYDPRMRDIPEVGLALTFRKRKRERGRGCGGEFFRFREAKSRTLSAKKKFERLRRKRHVVTRVQAAIARREREKLRFSLARRVSPTFRVTTQENQIYN